MKSGHLIEYNMTNIFLEKPYTKCGGKLVPDLLQNIKIENVPRSTAWNVIKFVFIECPSEGLPKDKIFSKNKKDVWS